MTTDKPDEHGGKKILGSPYGPQAGQVDEAAGGADSSPLENVPTEERKDAAKKAKRQTPGPAPEE